MADIALVRSKIWTYSTAALAGSLLVLLPGPSSAHEGHDESGSAELMEVVSVRPDGPAASAGLAAGDRILAWDGEALQTQEELGAFLGARYPGDRVQLDIERAAEALSLVLTLGDRGDGTPSLGLSLGVAASGEAPPATEDSLSSDACRSWLAATYKVTDLASELELNLSESIAETRTCVDGDLAQMPPEIPRGWCDNVFKVHCSGLDLLAEVGDALVARCEASIEQSHGIDVSREREWAVCGEAAVFDAYSLRGEVLDAAACERIFVDECGGSTASSGGP